MADAVRIRSSDIEFAWQDDSPDNSYYLDLVTGDIKLVNRNLSDLKDLTDEIEKHFHRYLYLPKPQAGQLKEDLRDFMETVEDKALKPILEMTFESPHVLSGFKSVLGKSPGEQERLENFRRSRVRVRIQQWLQANHLHATIYDDSQAAQTGKELNLDPLAMDDDSDDFDDLDD